MEKPQRIETNRRLLPLITILLIVILALIGVWFLRGGSFRLYASLFFGLYYLTRLSWLSIILVSVIQNIFFLPFRIIQERLYPDLKRFEAELEKTKKEDQYFLFHRKIREGDISIIFYILNFVFLLIAFVSAGRVFLLEFYHTPLDRSFLYSFIPYPAYPLKGVIFYFPFVRITQSYAVGWKIILSLIGSVILFLSLIRFLWRFLRLFLSGNRSLLRLRIGYNRLLVLIGGFIGTLLILLVFFLRHIPAAGYFYYLSADLSRQNTAFNIITAICTFFAAIYSGIKHNSEATREARRAGIPQNIIDRVSRANLRNSARNGLFLGLTALWVTRLMPSSHDLSVLAFEAIYVLSPVTFDLLIPKSPHRSSS